MEKEIFTKFRSVLISFNEVISQEVFNFTPMTSFSQMRKTFHQWLPFHIFVNFVENKLSTKFYDIFNQF